MNIYLIDIICKAINLLLISLMATFNFGNYSEEIMTIKNYNSDKVINIESEITDYDTNIVYNSKVPYNLTNVLTKGVVGITYNKELKDGSIELVTLQENTTEILEKGTGANGLYVGNLTGYSADCGAGCTGEGYVACKTESKERFSIKYEDIYYEDDQYGNVRILATSTSFPCGTIIKVSKTGYEPFYAVVMDRGGAMISAWEKGIVLMDLAYLSNDQVSTDGLTGKNIEFSVQRWGW
ncbi:MAG: hypothetical protein ACK5HP_02005 [Bacilli bacterium]